MLNNLTGWHFLVILVVILLLFGAPKLPGLAKSIGQSMHIFKREVKSLKDDDKTDAEAAAAAAAAAAPGAPGASAPAPLPTTQPAPASTQADVASSDTPHKP